MPPATCAQQPVGPRPNGIPILIARQRPQGTASRGDPRRHLELLRGGNAPTSTSSGRASRRSQAICAVIGRDPASIGRSVGVTVDPTLPAGQRPDVLSGTPEDIADSIRPFRDAGFTQMDMMLHPASMAAIDAIGEVLVRFDAG